MRRILRFLGWALLALLVIVAVGMALSWDTIKRTALGGYHDHDVAAPMLPAGLHRPAVLVFSKTNAFRHEEAIPAANAMIGDIARRRGWQVFATENGAVFDPELLQRFDAVVFNNTSGDAFSEPQKAALQRFIEGGGGFVGIHAAGDGSIPWPWYQQQVIGARFIGHPMFPQFQPGKVRMEDHAHPATALLPDAVHRVDEWYHFERSPRPKVRVLATLDEASLSNHKMFGKDLSMGADHPVAWWRCTGKGRVFYTAMGHTAESYSQPVMRGMIAGALDWEIRKSVPDCP